MRLESLDFTGFLEGYRRNEESTTEGIDTICSIERSTMISAVEMKKARLRALTRFYSTASREYQSLR